jgi:outer membrane receptor protein involved in Fe transport
MAKFRFAISVSALSLLASQAAAQVAAEPSQDAAAGQTGADAEQTPEITVTGSRLRSGFNAPTPVTVLSAAAIAEQRAPAQIADVLNEIPSFRPSGGASQGQFGTSAVGQATVDLRTLGTVRTLVLVDGRRPVGTQLNGTFDINLIPAGLIDRIDVATGGASAAYGSDAVAGVVNFILKDRIEGFQGTISSGISDEGDNSEQNLALAYGTALAEGRVRVLLGGDYSRSDGVESLYAREWGRRQPGIFTPTAPRTAGVPAQVIGEGIEIKNPPGGVIASGPLAGTAFGLGGVPYAYSFGALNGSTEQQGGSNYGFNRLGNQYIRGPYERYTALGRVTVDAGATTSLFVEGNYGKLTPRSRTQYANYSTLLFRTDNPFLPQQTRAALLAASQPTFRLGRVFADLGPTSTRNTDETLRAAFGGRGKLSQSWSWDAYYEYGRSRLDFDIFNVPIVPNLFNALFAVRDASGAIVCGPVATNPNLSATQRGQVDPGCQPFNPFGPTSSSAVARDYVNGEIQGRSQLTQHVGAVNVQGELVQLPAGPLAVAFGYEHRRLKGQDTVTEDTLRHSIIGAYIASNRLPSSGRVVVNEGYAEVDVPLLDGAPLAHKLSVNGAVRYTDYSTSGGVTTWKAGVVYAPFDGLRLRATRSRDIRAPNIAELFGVAPEGGTTQTNPSTGASAQIRTQAVSNPNLQPEIADTYTVGAVLESADRRLRLSVDYYNISIEDVIISVSAAEVLRRFYVLGQTAEYGPFIDFVPTSQNPTGFQKVSSPFVNASALRTDGVDLELVYSVPTARAGTFNLSVLGTWVNRLRTTDISGTIDSAGGTIPDKRVVANFGYKLDKFSTNLQARYNSGRKFSDTLRGPEDAGYDPASPTSISKNRFPSAVYLTLSANYAVIDEGDRKVQMFAVVNNLLDNDPPTGSYAFIGAAAGVNYYDFIGRTYTAGVRFAF